MQVGRDLIGIQSRRERLYFLEAVLIEEAVEVVEAAVEAVVVAKGRCEFDGRFGVELNERAFPARPSCQW